MNCFLITTRTFPPARRRIRRDPLRRSPAAATHRRLGGDPHVERLIEAFAYGARIRCKLDDDFPEISPPFSTCSIPTTRADPPMAIRSVLDRTQGELTTGYGSRDAVLRRTPSRGSRAASARRTGQAVAD